MKTTKILAYVVVFLLPLLAIGQTATVKGITFDENNDIVGGVNISFNGGGTQSDSNGYYLLEIPANKEVTVTFSYVGLEKVVQTFNLTNNSEKEFHPVLKTDIEQISNITITSSRKQRKAIEGITTLSPETVRKLPGANAGAENLIKIATWC